MKHVRQIITLWILSAAVLLGHAQDQPAARAEHPPVTAPPESFFEMVSPRDRDPARQFYKKYIDVRGMPVVASGEVAA